MAKSFATPLRYPGGKGRLGAWLSEIISYNGLNHGCYIEPYAGGAGAAMYLLSQGIVRDVVINDIDPVIHSFWYSVLNDTERFVELIKNTPLTIDEWHIQKNILNEGDLSDVTRFGFSGFYLNRTNRSGIIRGGVIGGQKQQGKYKIDARYNRQGLIDRVRLIGSMRKKIKLYNLDAIQLLDEIGDDEFNFYYLDPPYYRKGEQLYTNSYKEKDHRAVARKVKRMTSPWIVTYDNCDEIKCIYDWGKTFEFSLFYSTHLSRPVGREICFYNNLHLNKKIYLKR